MSSQIELGIIDAAPVSSTKGYWDVLIYSPSCKCRIPFLLKFDVIDQPKNILNNIDNNYTESHMQLPNEMRDMLVKCEHDVLICLAPRYANKSSQYSSLR